MPVICIIDKNGITISVKLFPFVWLIAGICRTKSQTSPLFLGGVGAWLQITVA